MMPKQIVFSLVTFLHDLFTVVWIGGMITLGAVVLPASKKVLGRGKETQGLVATIQNRLAPLSYVSMIGLAITGILLSRASGIYGGAFSFANPFSAALSIKHVLSIAMVAIALVRRFAFSAARGPKGADHARWNAGLLLTNIILGVAVLVLSAFTSVLAG